MLMRYVSVVESPLRLRRNGIASPSEYCTVLPGVQLSLTVSQPAMSTDAGNAIGVADDAAAAAKSTAVAVSAASTPAFITVPTDTAPREAAARCTAVRARP